MSARYHRADSDDSASDAEDLALEELDPVEAEDGLSPRRQALQGALRYQTRGLGGAFRLHKYSASQTDDRGHGEGHSNGEELKRHSGASVSVQDDDAPLLPTGIGESAAASLQLPSLGGERPKPGGFSGLLARMRQTPNSVMEDEYGKGDARDILVGRKQTTRCPPNIVSNAKYTPWSFLPRTLYHEFSFFLNLYFLLVALSQLIPELRIGVLSTYIAPLAFVLIITLGKEAIDDITRRRRDAEANSEKYLVLNFDTTSPNRTLFPRLKRERKLEQPDISNEEQDLESSGLRGVPELSKKSSDLKVGDVIRLGRDQRVPADVVILKTEIGEGVETQSDSSGEAFIRTDQLDGETDWKLRLASPLTQALRVPLLEGVEIRASKPERDVNSFIGSLKLKDGSASPLTIDNTAWANTVMASSCSLLAVIVYTGPQTRQAMSTSASRSKTGLLEFEINSLTKILCLVTLLLSILLVVVGQVESDGKAWFLSIIRYLVLFSTIVPISLRVNLDLAKSMYAWDIHHDKDIRGTVVRTSTIPEDLGRIEYLLSDKTGTLTQNDMQLKKIHVGTVSYANEAMSEVSSYIRQGFTGVSSEATDLSSSLPTFPTSTVASTRSRREIGSRVRDLVLALVICHNVTPTNSEQDGKAVTTYQASSPDEIAIVRWTESVGLRLAHRDRQTMILESTTTGQVIAKVKVLHLFPFTSEGKRMGIIIKFVAAAGSINVDEPIWFFQKGADTVMSSIVASNDWLDEETANMAREGLRTLVVGRKRLQQQQLDDFSQQYKNASLSMQDRDVSMARVVSEFLERDLELLGVTGVEDKLQRDVKPSLELLRNAGVKIWMLTGDKVETARCVAVSSKLVARGQYVHVITKMKHKEQAQNSLDFLRGKPDACLLIDGDSLALMLAYHEQAFISTAVQLSAVIACRCSPTQKAEVAQLIRSFTKKRICCIGDGGNDVSMIQAADVGVGIVGKEGRQASLAADFSVDQFCYLTKLLVWHGRNSYKRSAKLGQFVIHRGLIIAVCQTVHSVTIGFAPDALYLDWLLVGYATVYTMMPVFSLVLDTDIPPQLAHLYPELYAELSTAKSLSYYTFFIWMAISVYQGVIIQLLSQVLVPLSYDETSPDSTGFRRMVSVSFTVLILNELIMVATEVTTWHWVMITVIFLTAGIYFGSVPFLGRYFDLDWVLTLSFWWRVAAIVALSVVPVYAVKIIRRRLRPPSYRKVQQGL